MYHGCRYMERKQNSKVLLLIGKWIDNNTVQSDIKTLDLPN